MRIAVAEQISVPAEWAPQKAIWTAWPADPDQWNGDLKAPRRDVAALVPGVALVAVNPPPEVVDEAGISVLRGGRLPLKTSSMRGVVLGPPYGGDPAWVQEAARVVLPGLRVVGEGPDPDPELVDLMASAGGVWVGIRRR